MRHVGKWVRVVAVLSVPCLAACASETDDGQNLGASTGGGLSGTGVVTGAGGVSAGQGGAGTALGTSTSVAATTTTGGAGSSGSSAGGTATSVGVGGAESCTTVSWDPPATARGSTGAINNGAINTGIPAGLTKEWARSGETIMDATNIKIRQMMENGGQMRYCARWDSDEPITYNERQQAAALMAKIDKQWTDQLTGWGCWPYSSIDTRIVMWVVKDADLLEDWSESEGSYVVSSDADVPCPTDCIQYPAEVQMTSCSEEVYDEFLWLDASLGSYTGWGYAEGFYMDAGYFMSAATSNASTETIVAHELGHAHGLNDFYTSDVIPTGWTSFVMMAGSSDVVTDTDGWMLRDVWRRIRAEWGYPAAE